MGVAEKISLYPKETWNHWIEYQDDLRSWEIFIDPLCQRFNHIFFISTTTFSIWQIHFSLFVVRYCCSSGYVKCFFIRFNLSNRQGFVLVSIGLPAGSRVVSTSRRVSLTLVSYDFSDLLLALIYYWVWIIILPKEKKIKFSSLGIKQPQDFSAHKRNTKLHLLVRIRSWCSWEEWLIFSLSLLLGQFQRSVVYSLRFYSSQDCSKPES